MKLTSYFNLKMRSVICGYALMLRMHIRGKEASYVLHQFMSLFRNILCWLDSLLHKGAYHACAVLSLAGGGCADSTEGRPTAFYICASESFLRIYLALTHVNMIRYIPSRNYMMYIYCVLFQT